MPKPKLKNGIELYRFVSKKEIDGLRNNHTVYNNKVHSDFGNHTDSVGFCFFEMGHPSISAAYEFISGIVDEYAVVVVELDFGEVKEGYGTYANPYGSFFDSMIIEEFSKVYYTADDVTGVYYLGLADDIKDLKMYDLNDLRPEREANYRKHINKEEE